LARCPVNKPTDHAPRKRCLSRQLRQFRELICVQQGKQLFEGLCADCHGFEGTGGRGPNLNRPLTRAQDDSALRAIISDGLPDRGMPSVRRTTPNEQRQLVAYVRSLGRAASGVRGAGDAQKGSAIYQRSGCASCHVVNGEGGTTGPELTSIGTQRGPDYLRQAVIDPGAVLPHGTLPVPSRNLDEFLPVRVVTRDGREVRGLRINEDTFTIQLRDSNGQLYSFRKADLGQVEKEFGKSVMPSFKDRLTASEVDDLTAYLSSLGGAK
jgi:cytochrome c oxidase cbb3-type subunit 3